MTPNSLCWASGWKLVPPTEAGPLGKGAGKKGGHRRMKSSYLNLLRLMSQGVGISRQSRAPGKGTSLFPQGNTQEDLSLGRAGPRPAHRGQRCSGQAGRQQRGRQGEVTLQ